MVNLSIIIDKQALSIKYFIKLFELGNTIRGWKGCGDYVPLDQLSSMASYDEIDLPLLKFKMFIKSLPHDLAKTLGSLPIKSYDEGQFHDGHGTIKSNFQTGGYTNLLIISGKLMATAIYYLQEYCGYSLPNIDITTLKM